MHRKDIRGTHHQCFFAHSIAPHSNAGKPPIVIAAYITQCIGPESKRSAMLAEFGRLVSDSLT
jgi:hypothetical protein